jgi:3-hydroxypropanoate dehydrogenase
MAETLEPQASSAEHAATTPHVPTGDEDVLFPAGLSQSVVAEEAETDQAAATAPLPTGDEDLALPSDAVPEEVPSPPHLSDAEAEALNRAVPGLDRLFLDARTPIGWTDRPVEDETLRRLYELMKLGPTSANSSPARFLFLRGQDSRETLRQTLSAGNVEAVMAAPVIAIVAYDPVFYDKLYRLYPQADARSWFAWNDEFSQETAFRNGTLQGAYLIAAARLLGLDCWPMSGVDAHRVDQLFLDTRGWRTNFLVSLGYGIMPEGPRNPRLAFEEACDIL